MAAQTQAFSSSQARLLAQGRISTMSRVYAAPLPVFLLAPDGWHVLGSRHAVVETFWAKYRDVRAAGVGSLRASVTKEAWLDGERCRVEVVWFYVGDGGRRLGRTVAEYFLSRRPEGFCVDMIEFRRVAFPQLRGWFVENATELRRGVPLFR